jgi:parallel beta-helix repeat protein
MHNTIIDVSFMGTGVRINSGTVVIDNLQFRNAGGKITDSLVHILAGDVDINNCIFYNARHGILAATESRMTITYCSFYHTAMGIRSLNNQNMVVTHCNFIKNGIGVLCTESNSITIHNIWGELNGVTIMTEKCNNIHIANCVLCNGNENQVNLYLEKSTNIVVDNCTIYHSGRGIRFSDCHNATIKKTHLYDSKIGIETSNLSSLSVTDSQIHHNDVGIYLHTTKKTLITNNDIHDNSVANLAGEDSSGDARYNWWGKSAGRIQGVYTKGGRITKFPALKQHSLQDLQEPVTFSPPDVSKYTSQIQDNPIDNDTDGDEIPDWWEAKYGYNPLVYDPHDSLDPDQDGLDNIEEFHTYQWGSKPFTKDLFVEIDIMDASYEIREDKLEEMRLKFASNDITLHIDKGFKKGGEIVDKVEYVNYATLIDIYWKYFLYDDPTYWRKGVFHYVLLSDSLFKNGPGFVFIGWDEADSFALSISYYEEEIPQVFRSHVLATVFMHELGHTLGLFHDVYPAIDNESSIIPFPTPLLKGQIKYRNYRSCMNYQFAWQILDYSDGGHGRGDFDDWRNINLSFFQNSHWGL